MTDTRPVSCSRASGCSSEPRYKRTRRRRSRRRLCLAQRIAARDVSAACTTAPGSARAIASAIAPHPVPTSITIGCSCAPIRSSVRPTKSGASGVGTKTPGAIRSSTPASRQRTGASPRSSVPASSAASRAGLARRWIAVARRQAAPARPPNVAAGAGAGASSRAAPRALRTAARGPTGLRRGSRGPSPRRGDGRRRSARRRRGGSACRGVTPETRGTRAAPPGRAPDSRRGGAWRLPTARARAAPGSGGERMAGAPSRRRG